MEADRDLVIRCVRYISSPLGILTWVYVISVLAIIQEKVNNPSPDDPFEPEIAAVREVEPSSCRADDQYLANEERLCEIFSDG